MSQPEVRIALIGAAARAGRAAAKGHVGLLGSPAEAGWWICDPDAALPPLRPGVRLVLLGEPPTPPTGERGVDWFVLRRSGLAGLVALLARGVAPEVALALLERPASGSDAEPDRPGVATEGPHGADDRELHTATDRPAPARPRRTPRPTRPRRPGSRNPSSGTGPGRPRPRPAPAPQAGAGPEPIHPEQRTAADARRLTADFYDADTPLRRALPPRAALTLVLRIAVPEAGQPAGDVAVPLPEDPSRASVVLDVTVAGASWPRPQTQQIAVPTGEPGAPSTSAAFDLVTPDAGGVVDVQVSVTHRGRPLQVAAILAPVRARPAPGDRVDVSVSATTSGPLPVPGLAAGATREAVTVDARGSDLVNLATGDLVPQSDVADLLRAAGASLSRVLGSPLAPASFADPQARALLVELARRGATLRQRLAPLGLGDTAELNLLVLGHGTLFPFELVYSGPAPRRGATVCEHPGPDCPPPTSRRVCPRAFWGASRVICRTVQRHAWAPAPGPVRLGPALFAAAARADAGSLEPAPSGVALAGLAAAASGTPVRVTSWTAWRREIRTRGPGLLVVLGHVEEVPGDRVLEIGRASDLSLADVGAAHVLRAGGAPPLVVLVACSTALAADPFGSLHGAWLDHGAAAVVGTLAQLNGVQGAEATVALVSALREVAASGRDGGLGAAVTAARSALLARGLLVGLLLISHGEIALEVAA